MLSKGNAHKIIVHVLANSEELAMKSEDML